MYDTVLYVSDDGVSDLSTLRLFPSFSVLCTVVVK